MQCGSSFHRCVKTQRDRYFSGKLTMYRFSVRKESRQHVVQLSESRETYGIQPSAPQFPPVASHPSPALTGRRNFYFPRHESLAETTDKVKFLYHTQKFPWPSQPLPQDTHAIPGTDAQPKRNVYRGIHILMGEQRGMLTFRTFTLDVPCFAPAHSRKI